MQLVKDKKQWFDPNKVVVLRDYKGVCDACGAAIEYDGDIFSVEVDRDDDAIIFFLLTSLSCPSCFQTRSLLRRWHKMDVTSELETIKHENTGTGTAK